MDFGVRMTFVREVAGRIRVRDAVALREAFLLGVE